MVVEWLLKSATAYNRRSLAERDAYTGIVMLPVRHLETILEWAFQSLPDEILIGFDVDANLPHHAEVIEAYEGDALRDGLFQGEGFVLGEPHLVNRGDSYSVHHVPEEWVDGLFAADRGSRGGRFTHWMHTHPNAVAIPSEADADAAQYTEGVDMILGIEFSPEGMLPWFEDVEGVRRRLEPDNDAAKGPRTAEDKERESETRKVRSMRRGWGRGRRRRQSDSRIVIGRAPTGHDIHGLELISFHRSGVGINVILVDGDGWPIGWDI